MDTEDDPSKYKFFVKTVQGAAIRTLFEVLKEIVHDVSLVFDSTGIKLSTMDGARCALIYMKLQSTSFDKFFCPEPVHAGLNMSHAFQLLRMTGSHDTITFYQEHSHTDEMGIKIQNADKNSTTDFKLRLMDVDTEVIKIKDEDFHSIITMPSTYFQRLCRDMSNISNIITIRSEGNTLSLICNGDFARQETHIGEAVSGMNISSTPEKRIESSYSLKYLSLFCKASSLCNTIELYLKENYPLILKYNIASLGEIRFVLAPQLE